jgi:hypothetical protein|tara:strand:+ start:820 stop:981 length:162 start_codon:yes stop_codon:yes gene_type:complete
MKIDMTKLNKKADIVAAEVEEARAAALEVTTLADAIKKINALETRLAALEATP